MFQLATRSFSLDDQRWFAELSGDRNPLHVDPVVARRSLFGQPVVHGVHALTWAVDAFLAQRASDVERIAVAFRRPVLLDELVEAWVARDASDNVDLQVRRGDSVLVAARLHLGRNHPATPTAELPVAAAGVLDGPRVLQPGEIAEGRTGRLVLPADSGLVADGFPSAAAQLGSSAVAALFGLSTLVGMECPGLHSLFTGFDVRLTGGTDDGPLGWKVTRADDRFGAVRMAVSCASLYGTVDAFVRPPPTAQVTSAELNSLVNDGEFASMRALVIGGSRGLGELTAKMVAAGGGEAVITWHRGEADALNVVDDIESSGGRAASVQFDVGDPEPAELLDLLVTSPPTHLFYFATPRIFARRTQQFHQDLYDEFSSVYVAAFVRLVDRILSHGGESGLVAFYPSTVAIDEHLADLTEYAAAKAAGEVVARTLDATRTDLRVIVERLPRLPTDQTASVVAVPAEPPTDVMLRIVRDVAAG